MVWNKMKNYIQEHFREKLGQDALRNAVMEAWNAVETSYLAELVTEMLARCQAVIDANGMQTKY